MTYLQKTKFYHEFKQFTYIYCYSLIFELFLPQITTTNEQRKNNNLSD